MKFAALLAALPLLLVTACGGGDANTTAPAGSVAAVKPPAGKNWLETVSKTPEGGFRMGNPDAPLKLVEYGSRACPYCGMFDAEGFPVLKSDYIATGKVSYEFREYPIHGALDLAPILLGQCTGDTATFFPLLDQMFKNQETLLQNEQAVSARVQAMPNPTPNQVATAYAEGLGYIDFMKQRGLPEDKARACLNDPAGIKRITDQAKFAEDKFQVNSTPTFILNDVKLDSVDTWAKLKAVLAQRGA
ncbi:DsbA family protein [Sphingomonas sp.]|uniref:DsbA family protein n=1 Tax=Sphingomonas sp. TaxID=28214 RepID=UPI002E35BA1C|nr:thioredoxin domain-containing protein [Sphingomonas sp.]HEX4694292.1 thioredoxin domain-containing protein [Sphingomonas sp.]